ncbi:MAG: hypothetical protein HQM09_15635 [Candidatus Riflebacteria bacterium]|nr:hypothetical protein [Candidatus Riflebacteria bacterium]
MKASEKSLSIKAMLLAFFLAAFPAPILHAQEEGTDATHLFEAETLRLAETQSKETRAEFDQRTKGIVQCADQRPQQIGDVVQFNVMNIALNQFEKRSGVLRKIGTHCYVFVEQGRTLTPAVLDKIVHDFDEQIYPTNIANFGTEWNPGIDGDPRITLFLLDIHDNYNPGSNQLAFTAGYFFSGDEYTHEKSASSNEREILYIDLYPGDPAKPNFMSVVAHEFQHMIHWHHDPKENPWINESMSQLASYLNGYGHPTQLSSFFRNPDNDLFSWSPETMIANYGQAYLFSYYMSTHLASTQAARQTLTRSIVEEKSDGIIGVEKAFAKCGIKSSFADVFRDFCVANYLNDSSFAGGLFGYGNTFPQMQLPILRTHDQAVVSDKGTVKLWSACAVKINIAGVSSGFLNVSFGGGVQASKTSKNLCNNFDVAAILIDSKHRAPTKLEWLTIRNYQAHQTLKTPAGSHDTLMLVIVNRGPSGQSEVSFARNSTPVQFAYSVNKAAAETPVTHVASVNGPGGKSGKGSVQRVASGHSAPSHANRRAIHSMMETQASRSAPETPSSADGVNAAVDGIMVPAELDKLSGEDEQIISSMRSMLEAGDSGCIEDFFSVHTAATPTGQANLHSLRTMIIDLVRFEVFQNNHPELEPFIQRLLDIGK